MLNDVDEIKQRRKREGCYQSRFEVRSLSECNMSLCKVNNKNYPDFSFINRYSNISFYSQLPSLTQNNSLQVYQHWSVYLLVYHRGDHTGEDFFFFFTWRWWAAESTSLTSSSAVLQGRRSRSWPVWEKANLISTKVMTFEILPSQC